MLGLNTARFLRRSEDTLITWSIIQFQRKCRSRNDSEGTNIIWRLKWNPVEEKREISALETPINACSVSYVLSLETFEDIWNGSVKIIMQELSSFPDPWETVQRNRQSPVTNSSCWGKAGAWNFALLVAKLWNCPPAEPFFTGCGFLGQTNKDFLFHWENSGANISRETLDWDAAAVNT